MGKNRKSRLRSERVLGVILKILETVDSPLPSGEIAYLVESSTNFRCSVYSVANILRPLVLRNEIKRTRIEGSKKFTYELI